MPQGKDWLDGFNALFSFLGVAVTTWVAVLALRLQKRELRASVLTVFIEKRLERLQEIAEKVVQLRLLRESARPKKTRTKSENTKALTSFTLAQKEIAEALRGLAILHEEVEGLCSLWKDRSTRDDVDIAITKCQSPEAVAQAALESEKAEKAFLSAMRAIVDGSKSI